MIPSLHERVYGQHLSNQTSIRGHLRPLDNYRGLTHIVWPWLLDNVRYGLGKSDKPSNLCDIRVSSRNRKGET